MLKKDFRYILKQHGCRLAKGWLLGRQFQVLFEDGLYYELGKHAVSMAYKLRDGFIKKGVENTIQAIGSIARVGMCETDKEIIQIMLDE